jgi:hypothetical protein
VLAQLAAAVRSAACVYARAYLLLDLLLDLLLAVCS